MSKIFEALDSMQATSVDPVQKFPILLQEARMPESGDHWKEQYYPKYTEHKIDDFLDYLLSLHESGAGATYGIVPVSGSSDVTQIVLETFMHLSANCEGSKLLADLSTDRLLLKQLEESNALDKQYRTDESDKVLPILHNLFHFFAKPEESSQTKSGSKFQYPELIKLTETYSFSLFMFPTVSKFNISSVQLARKVDNIVLMSPENMQQDLKKANVFLDKLNVKAKGVYFFE